MIIKRKTQIILALLVTCVFLFQGCASIISGTSQKIPVTSNPSGIKITVDGEETGQAPLVLKLKRKKKIHVNRIEKPGYNPFEIRITRKTSAKLSSYGNVLYGALGFLGGFLLAVVIDESLPSSTVAPLIIGGTILGWGGAITIDFLSGANYTLSPAHLNVTLKKQEGNAQPDLILLDARRFRSIKWIRIRCDNSDGEENSEKN